MNYEKTEYKYRLDGQPDFAFLTVEIPAGRTIKVEASAMATMDTNIAMKTKMRGGLGRLLTGESMFVNEFTAQGAQGELGIAPPGIGDIAHVYLENETIYLQGSGFVACSPSLAIESKWQGMKGFFSGERLFLVKCSGTGDLWFNSFGAIYRVDVQDSYTVDTGHIVAFSDTLEYSVGKFGGYKSMFLSGEGLVCKFKGHGSIWVQTRKLSAFTWWLQPFRPAKRN